MKKHKIYALIILLMFFSQQVSIAALWTKSADKKLGNELKIEEYPDSKDVEPKLDSDSTKLIIGGVEEVMDITLDECIACALGNNPRIQAAMQDVFASDARIKQAWSTYFPQFSWQTG